MSANSSLWPPLGHHAAVLTKASRLSGSSAKARSKKPRAARVIGGISSLVEPCDALKIEIHRVGIWRPFRPPSLVGDQLGPQLAGETGDDFVLQTEEISERLVETLGPEMTAARGVDGLGVDPNAALVALDRALQHVADA